MNLRGRNKVNPNFNMSSMTDIVFLLLIFFMLTSTLVTVNAIDVLLPKASGKTENKTSVSVTVTNKSKFYIDKAEISEKNLEPCVATKEYLKRKTNREGFSLDLKKQHDTNLNLGLASEFETQSPSRKRSKDAKQSYTI